MSDGRFVLEVAAAEIVDRREEIERVYLGDASGALSQD